MKYLKRNFLPGRTFVDLVDFQTQLDEWTATIADRRIHGTTHEEPLVRFARERNHLVPLADQRAFQQEARVSRIVAEDYLVSLATNRYSVPFRLIGQRVEVQRRGTRSTSFTVTKRSRRTRCSRASTNSESSPSTALEPVRVSPATVGPR
ncbi:MAG: hypothetical protein P0119_09070 [Nitrospira sp.]|nr:hypothetical protein [Nitrospira sp.]